MRTEVDTGIAIAIAGLRSTHLVPPQLVDVENERLAPTIALRTPILHMDHVAFCGADGNVPQKLGTSPIT